MKNITERQKKILKIITEEYIKSGLPISSRVLINTNQINSSSATIRKEMVILEKEGLLEKKHFSSGSKPSTNGYRFYVQELMNLEEDDQLILKNIKKKIEIIFKRRKATIEYILNKTCDIISQITHSVSIVTSFNDEEKLKKIFISQLKEKKIIIIAITDKGHTSDKIIFIEKVNFIDLQAAVKIFNQRLKGKKIVEIKENMEFLRSILTNQIKKYEYIVKLFLEVFVNFTIPYKITSGVNYLFENPKKYDIKEIESIINFATKELPWKHFNNQKFEIKIGDEINKNSKNLAVISSSFRIDGGDKGKIIVIGDKRFEYNKIVKILLFISKFIENNLTKSK
jgi:heat-inducible transcriptional repressor